MGAIKKVCSDRPRAFAQGNDTFHLTYDGQRTVCGVNCETWLRMGELEDHEVNSPWLCRRCHKKATQEGDR